MKERFLKKKRVVWRICAVGFALGGASCGGGTSPSPEALPSMKIPTTAREFRRLAPEKILDRGVEEGPNDESKGRHRPSFDFAKEREWVFSSSSPAFEGLVKRVPFDETIRKTGPVVAMPALESVLYRGSRFGLSGLLFPAVRSSAKFEVEVLIRPIRVAYGHGINVGLYGILETGKVDPRFEVSFLGGRGRTGGTLMREVGVKVAAAGILYGLERSESSLREYMIRQWYRVRLTAEPGESLGEVLVSALVRPMDSSALDDVLDTTFVVPRSALEEDLFVGVVTVKGNHADEATEAELGRVVVYDGRGLSSRDLEELKSLAQARGWERMQFNGR